MRINKAEVFNFQSHENTVIEPDENFTILVGSSNSGKSSLLRAIKWCLTNTPSGNSFIRIGQKSARVKVTMDDGHAIERERGKGSSLNYYRLFKDGELLEEYTGFGTGVPDAIKEVAGDTSSWDYTFADQLESPFLISETPGKRADRIGNLEDFAKLDSVITKIKEEERETKKKEREAKKELSEVLSAVKGVDEEISIVKPLYKQLEKVYEEVSNKTRKTEKLNQLLDRLKSVEVEIPNLKECVEKSEYAIMSYRNLDDKVSRYQNVESVYKRLLYVQNELKDIHVHSDELMSGLIEQIKKVDSAVEKFKEMNRLITQVKRNEEGLNNVPSSSEEVAAINLEPIELAINKYKSVALFKNGLQENQASQADLKEQVRKTYDEIESLLSRFVEEIQAKEKCPTCTQGTNGINIETIKNNL